MSLYELLRQNQFRGLSLARVRSIGAQVLRALVAMQHAGVLHCDLKPENILLENTSGSVCMLVFWGFFFWCSHPLPVRAGSA